MNFKTYETFVSFSGDALSMKKMAEKGKTLKIKKSQKDIHGYTKPETPQKANNHKQEIVPTLWRLFLDNKKKWPITYRQLCINIQMLAFHIMASDMSFQKIAMKLVIRLRTPVHR